MNVRHHHPDERHATASTRERSNAADSRNAALQPITIVVVSLFWISQFAANTLFNQLTSPEDVVASLLPRALVTVAAEVITLGFIALQDRWRRSRLAVRACWAIACTLLSSAILSVANSLIFKAVMGTAGDSGFWVAVGYQLIPRVWVFGSIYAISLAIAYSGQVREREEEIAALRSLAQDAQLRALRSQLQPHFLFNALNSIAALIRDGQAQQAELTTEQLSDFLRITLSLDPQRLITLSEETSLQQIYLDIQKVRFPTRLNVIFDIAPNVERALVPNLILQPLVENSIKHAVARSTEPVTIEVSAAADEQKLKIIVEDDGGNASSSSPAKGNRMGLSNVAERLSAHFGNDSSLSSEANGNAGFRHVIVMPLRWRP